MKYFINTLIFIMFINPAYSQLLKPEENAPLKKVLFANVQFGRQIEGLNKKLVETALDFALQYSGKYELITARKRDSVVSSFAANKKQATVKSIARALNADRIVFINVNVLANIVRVSLNSVNAKTTFASEGVGYDFARYRAKGSDNPEYGPSLLAAIQRAFAVAEKDSMMYADLKGFKRAIPAKTLVVGGLEFIDKKKVEKWDLFHKKELHSYSAVEEIISKCRERDDYVVFDVASRDSIYAIFKLFLVENCHAMSGTEISALHKLEVECVISGKFTRTKDGADIEISLFELSAKGPRKLKTVKGSIDKDSVIDFKKKIHELTPKLFETN